MNQIKFNNYLINLINQINQIKINLLNLNSLINHDLLLFN